MPSTESPVEIHAFTLELSELQITEVRRALDKHYAHATSSYDPAPDDIRELIRLTVDAFISVSPGPVTMPVAEWHAVGRALSEAHPFGMIGAGPEVVDLFEKIAVAEERLERETGLSTREMLEAESQALTGVEVGR